MWRPISEAPEGEEVVVMTFLGRIFGAIQVYSHDPRSGDDAVMVWVSSCEDTSPATWEKGECDPNHSDQPQYWMPRPEIPD